jgi:hypothetical protein
MVPRLATDEPPPSRATPNTASASMSLTTIERAMGRTLPRRCLAAGGVLLAVTAPPAFAQGSPPPPLPGDAAIYQYREAVPTGGGPVAPTPGTTRVTPLPATVQAALSTRGGTAAPLLDTVATSSDYGAPQHRIRPPDAAPLPPGGTALPSPSPARGIEAAAASIADVPARVVALLTLLLATAAAVFLAARRTSRTAV